MLALIKMNKSGGEGDRIYESRGNLGGTDDLGSTDSSNIRCIFAGLPPWNASGVS